LPKDQQPKGENGHGGKSLGAWYKAHKPEAFLGVAGIVVALALYAKSKSSQNSNGTNANANQVLPYAEVGTSPGVGDGSWGGWWGQGTTGTPSTTTPAPASSGQGVANPYANEFFSGIGWGENGSAAIPGLSGGQYEPSTTSRDKVNSTSSAARATPHPRHRRGRRPSFSRRSDDNDLLALDPVVGDERARPAFAGERALGREP
jgi:hypothetical protein